MALLALITAVAASRVVSTATFPRLVQHPQQVYSGVRVPDADRECALRDNIYNRRLAQGGQTVSEGVWGPPSNNIFIGFGVCFFGLRQAAIGLI